jgi:hypothetical protein
MKGNRLNIAATGLLVAMLIFACWAAFPISHLSEAGASTPPQILVGAYYYPWYGNSDGSGGLGSRHWNDSAHGQVVDQPVIGYYSSMNLTELKWQVEMMEDAGFDFVLVSWWGAFGFEDNATKKFLEADEACGWPLKFAILIEPYDADEDMDYPALYSYINDAYAEPYADNYLNWQGKPLLGFFNPLHPPASEDFTTIVIGQTEYVDWILWAASNSSFTCPDIVENEDERVSADGYISVTPRYDDYYLYLAGSRDKFMRFDVDYTEGMCGRQWRLALVREDKGEIAAVVLFSWNEYHERSAVEPHIDLCGADPYLNYDLTKAFITQLHRSDAEKRDAAAGYLSSHYNATFNLIYESEEAGRHWLADTYPLMENIPYSGTFWLYSDNTIAYHALEPFDSSLASQIKASLAAYGYNETSNPPLLWEVLFGYDIPDIIHDAVNLPVDYVENDYAIFIHRHNATGTLDPSGYGDTIVYKALDLLWIGDYDGAETWFWKAYNLFDGKGIKDNATINDGFYANYKLALLLYTSKILELDLPLEDEIEAQLWSMQNAEHGGITSLADEDGNPIGSSNCETTSLTLLAHNTELITNLQWKAGSTPPDPQMQYYIWGCIVAAGGGFAYWVYRKRR